MAIWRYDEMERYGDMTIWRYDDMAVLCKFVSDDNGGDNDDNDDDDKQVLRDIVQIFSSEWKIKG